MLVRKRKASGPPKVMRSTLTPTALTTEKPWGFHDGCREEYGKDAVRKGATAGKDNSAPYKEGMNMQRYRNDAKRMRHKQGYG